MIPELHPACAAYPVLADDELVRMAESITAIGLVDSITLMPDGAVLDGRNRWLACEIAGVEPRTVVYSGNDPVRFVMARNHLRRHLPADDRAFIAAELANILRNDGYNRYAGRLARSSELADLSLRPVTIAEAAEKLGVSKKAAQTAKVLLRRAQPHIVQLVKAGEVGLQAAELATRYATTEEQQAWKTGDAVRVAAAARRAPPRKAQERTAPPPRPPRFRPAVGPLRQLTLEESGAPPPEISKEQAPGMPPGVTRMAVHIAKHGQVQIWSLADKERLEVRTRLTTLSSQVKQQADPSVIADVARLDDAFADRTKDAVSNRRRLIEYLPQAIENLTRIRDMLAGRQPAKLTAVD